MVYTYLKREIQINVSKNSLCDLLFVVGVKQKKKRFVFGFEMVSEFFVSTSKRNSHRFPINN